MRDPSRSERERKIASRVMLISPPITLDERYSKKLGPRAGGLQPPLGLAYLASVLEQHAIQVDIIDAPTLGMSLNDVVDKAEKTQPDIVGISILTPTASRGFATSEAVKKLLPETLVVVGGPHSSIFPRETLIENESVDVAVLGEGEYVMLEIAQGRPLKEVESIAFRQNRNVVLTSPRQPIRDLDSLPFPARHLLPMDKYKPHPNQYERLPAVHMLATRGCPYRCAFCSKAVFGRSYRTRSSENIVEEIKHCIEEYGAREISFVDDEFAIKRPWTIELCNRLIEENLGIVWRCAARVDTVDKELLEKMARAGCYNISYGVESGTQVLLDIIKKDITLDQARKAVRWTKEARIGVTASFMLALPGETLDLTKKTIDFAIELNPDYAQFCITTPYPGTELFEQSAKYGTLEVDRSKYTIWEPVFVPRGYEGKEQVRQMGRLAVRSFYLRPEYLISQIKKIDSVEALKRNIDGLEMVLRW